VHWDSKGANWIEFHTDGDVTVLCEFLTETGLSTVKPDTTLAVRGRCAGGFTGPSGRRVKVESCLLMRPAPPSFVPKVGDTVSLTGPANRIWVGDLPTKADEANRIEQDEGADAADKYAANTGGLRWVDRGARGRVTAALKQHAEVRVESGKDKVVIGWAAVALLQPLPPSGAPKADGR
jgi:hypothetical protein